VSTVDISKIIPNFLTKTKSEKVLALLNEMRTGLYYYSSKTRKALIGNYKSIIFSLSKQEYNLIKQHIIQNIPALINDRNSRKIPYSLLSEIIEYSCFNDIDIYSSYEKEIIKLAKVNKEKYLYHIITLAQTCKRMFDNIENIEDFFIERYLAISRINTINYRYLIDFTINVSGVDKRKFLTYLFGCRPFRNDKIIKSFILQHPELKSLGVLI